DTAHPPALPRAVACHDRCRSSITSAALCLPVIVPGPRTTQSAESTDLEEMTYCLRTESGPPHRRPWDDLGGSTRVGTAAGLHISKGAAVEHVLRRVRGLRHACAP